MGPQIQADDIRLELLGGFRCDMGAIPVHLAPSQQRLVAFVALRGPSRLRRSYVFGNLWPEHSEHRAAANLRSSLWRVQRKVGDLLCSDASSIWLHPLVRLDLEHLEQKCDARAASADLELLPGWYDEWLATDRERYRQQVIHAIEDRCRGYLHAAQHARAIDLAWQGIAIAPLRENTRSLLIEAHLAEGDPAAAMQQFDAWSHLLNAELGLAPGREIAEMLESAATQTFAHQPGFGSGGDATVTRRTQISDAAATPRP